jgi:hypothetical protein
VATLATVADLAKLGADALAAPQTCFGVGAVLWAQSTGLCGGAGAG